jgi:hypothetical protein
MNYLLRLFSAIVSIACFTLAATCVSRHEGLRHLGSEFKAALEEDTSQAAAVGRNLEEVRRAWLHSVDIKLDITDDLIGGRLTLLQAAMQFRAAEADLPQAMMRPILEVFPGGSDDERLCRKVISHVESALKQDPSQRQAVVQQLETELQEHVKRYGTVRLCASAEQSELSEP